MTVEEVVALTNDLLHEILSVNALRILVNNVGAVLETSRSARNCECLIMLVHLNETLDRLSGFLGLSMLNRF